ncbi:bifunctional [glutamine synthetase] adenylyltransferase/[glutamine synthetase]-adenylyl-L-tyrosine phosphorylase [Aquisediminimonas sediminicola]|uniref:bifunctional [glutamine synthetase] adenylyltransferase/[glutamine synthetase]-adenylyl-L-tyrosine phosphorylase n=1 Tax=Alteraquisediminimonas sediminicola TaxID=2676787 RepID=UPI001C8E0A88|nr:bifunctional [glutamine synthetase] adenylyltransferase/[glutamine synthetase]-adenylyl-L-tyrosine phosphorylase [Aquisediminimonas sediminicola]
MTADIANALQRANAHSPFLRRLIEKQPEVVDRLAGGDVWGALALGRAQALAIDDVGISLRRERDAVALCTAIGDLAGVLSFEEITHALSDFADRALDKALNQAFHERMPGEAPRGFAIIGLGKHGSRELNYSSDIDPIFLFDPNTLPRRERDEPVEAAVRLGKRVIDLLQTRTADGYAFRVDLRLRPSPEATPIALPVESAINYYESMALPWERAAFIRSRPAAGDTQLGQYFLDQLRPFVWRRSLDFGAINEIRGISRRIRDHYAQGQAFGPGYDLKRGRGGIRECEFFAQIHQMIHGGRDPVLRTPATLDALHALAAHGRIGADEAEALANAYIYYRQIEHRLQMVDDRQTHSLPDNADAINNVARLHGLADADALLASLRPHIDKVGHIYDSLSDDGNTGFTQDPELMLERCTALGFPDPAATSARITSWRTDRVRCLRTPAARDAFEAMLPNLLAALGKAPDPTSAVNRFDNLLTRIPTGINLFRLLEARPALATLLANILGLAPALAEDLARRPALLEGLIDARAFEPTAPLADLIAKFRDSGEKDEDYQQLLDRVRQQVGDERFALGVQLVEGTSDPMDVAQGYSRIAEAALQVLTDATIAEFELTHGKVAGGELVILALGRLGGGALTHASDLDLVFLFTGDHATESDGRKPLGATQYFNRLSQRIIAAMSVSTAAGPLYEVDTRLRPNGAQGLLAVNFESFETYQLHQAWTWEHMALTRARIVFGSLDARASLQTIVDKALHLPRDPAKLLADIVKMRRDMAKHKPPKGDLDVKLADGGLVDLEFTLHLLQLTHRTGLSPVLGQAVAALVEAGLLPAQMIEAHRLLGRMLVALRLIAPDSQNVPEAAKPVVAHGCGRANWESLLADYTAARHSIATIWHGFADQLPPEQETA